MPYANMATIPYPLRKLLTQFENKRYLFGLLQQQSAGQPQQQLRMSQQHQQQQQHVPGQQPTPNKQLAPGTNGITSTAASGAGAGGAGSIATAAVPSVATPTTGASDVTVGRPTASVGSASATHVRTPVRDRHRVGC